MHISHAIYIYKGGYKSQPTTADIFGCCCSNIKLSYDTIIFSYIYKRQYIFI